MVKKSTKAIVRIITGAVLAFILARIFRPESGPVFAAVLFVVMVGAAYGLELLHKRDKQ
ncbi:MAG: hypothetical protein K9J79_03065 [Desulfobacteraceae bacterium]|nr:hypothetical protein [Desulfobacteraceae bacterium]